MSRVTAWPEARRGMCFVFHSVRAVGFVALGVLTAAPLAGQSVDTSGMELFWQTADRISSGEALSTADWDVLFGHPAYAVTETSGQRRSVITHCMPAVFAPDGDVEAALRQIPDGDTRSGLYDRVCAHLEEVRDRRPELEAWLGAFDGTRLVREGLSRAAAYLPPGVQDEVALPAVYVVLFERQGFGTEAAIVLDGLTVMGQSHEWNAAFIGHEFHHAYRGAFTARIPDTPGAALLRPLDRIVSEGVASMIDKAGYVRSATMPPGFPPEFLELVAAAPDRLARIDSALASAERNPEGFVTAGRAVSAASPWGGHLNGLYMAMAIEEAFGTGALVTVQTGPVAFFTAYHRAVDALDDGRFRFSERAIEAVVAAGR